MTIFIHEAENIKQNVMTCQLCSDFETKGICIKHKEIGLNYTYPKKAPITILFVAESPPAPCKGFFYDEIHNNTKCRDKLFDYINRNELGQLNTIDDFNNKLYYLADVINCRWDKSEKYKISKKDINIVVNNCSFYLVKLIRLFKPKIIVLMGEKAHDVAKNPEVYRAIDQSDHCFEVPFPLNRFKEKIIKPKIDEKFQIIKYLLQN
jgi:hypothetical protein